MDFWKVLMVILIFHVLVYWMDIIQWNIYVLVILWFDSIHVDVIYQISKLHFIRCHDLGDIHLLMEDGYIDYLTLLVKIYLLIFEALNESILMVF